MMEKMPGRILALAVVGVENYFRSDFFPPDVSVFSLDLKNAIGYMLIPSGKDWSVRGIARTVPSLFLEKQKQRSIQNATPVSLYSF